MADRDLGSHGTESRGCLTTAAAAMVLATIAPIALIVQRLREWRRGPDVRATIHRTPLTTASGTDICRLDFTLDIPAPAEPGSRRRLTDAIVQIASSLRRTDDVYNLIYRLPSDPEPVVVPLGPQLQELGDRLFLVLSQGALEGRTAVWLTIGRDNTLSEVLDPLSCDPEGAADGHRVGPGRSFTRHPACPCRSDRLTKDRERFPIGSCNPSATFKRLNARTS